MELIEKYHFYINLNKRAERNKNAIEQLKLLGINKPNRFEAIEHEIGIVGCAKSHIKCIELAKERNYPFVCIFEDDVVFRDIEECQKMINKYIGTDYDVLYMGCKVTDNKYEFINEELIRINNAWCNHAYIVKSHYYDKLLENLYEGINLKIKAGKESHEKGESSQYNNDVYIGSLQRVDKWYSFYPHFASQKNGYSDDFNEERNFYEEIFHIPVHDSNLPHISILTPTFNRNNFLSLMINNIQHFTYPKEKIEWNILESNDQSLENYEKIFGKEDEIKYFEKVLGIKIKYKFINEKLTIGKKRNILSENSTHDYLINMDDDDIYLPSYLNHSIDILINHKKDITGCLDMLFIYPEKDYKTSYIRCIRDFKLYHEATLCMKKSHWKKYKYEETSEGEGKDIYGSSELCFNSDIVKCIICVCWKGNTVNKDRFLEYPIDMNIEGDSLNILKNIFNDFKMEEKKDIKIEISKELLQNIRNLIEVTNDRIKWKTEELLPVGVMIKQIDELLSNNSE